MRHERSWSDRIRWLVVLDPRERKIKLVCSSVVTIEFILRRIDWITSSSSMIVVVWLFGSRQSVFISGLFSLSSRQRFTARTEKDDVSILSLLVEERIGVDAHTSKSKYRNVEYFESPCTCMLAILIDGASRAFENVSTMDKYLSHRWAIFVWSDDDVYGFFAYLPLELFFSPELQEWPWKFLIRSEGTEG